MRDAAIKDAKRLAEIFIERVGEEYLHRYQYQNNGHTFHGTSSKARGALRRASMDLTRALAEMRKP